LKFPLFFLFELDAFCIVSIIPFYENLSIILIIDNVKNYPFNFKEEIVLEFIFYLLMKVI